MSILIPNPSFIIHESCYVYIILHYIYVPHHNIHTQPKQIIQHLALAEGSRSGWGVSLRRDSLAQARQSRSVESPSA